LLLIIDLCPEGMPCGFRRPLDKRLSQELWTLEAPVDPGLLAAAFRDRRNARLFLECVGGGKAVPLCAEGDEEAGGKHSPSPWQGVKQREVGMVLGALCAGFVEVGNGLQGDPELGDEGLHEEDIGGDDAVIGGQRSGALDSLDAGRDDVGRAHVGGSEEALKGGATCALCRVERRPAAQEVAKDRGSFVLKPRQDVGKGVFQGTGQAVGQTDCVADQAPAMFDELRQGAHGGALGAERGELVAVCEEDLDLECGIGGSIFGPARGTRFAVPGHGERMDGEEHEEIIVAQRGHDGSFLEFQAHRDGLSVEARAQGLDPGVNLFRTMFEAQTLPLCSASGLEADIVLRISPVEANKGRKCFGRLVASCVIASRVGQWCQGTCLLALCEGMRESRWCGRL
jgi:hypothetical protein